MRTFYRLRQTFSQVYCRKLAQCVGFEPTRRTNARTDSSRLQFHYGNTAKFSVYRQEIGKETVSTFCRATLTGGIEPPFCNHARTDCFQWKATGRSRTALNRIVLVAKGGTQCLKYSTKGSSTYEKHTWSHGTSTCNQLGYRDSNPEYRNQNPVPYRLAIAHHFQMTIIFIAKIAYESK